MVIDVKVEIALVVAVAVAISTAMAIKKRRSNKSRCIERNRRNDMSAVAAGTTETIKSVVALGSLAASTTAAEGTTASIGPS